MADRTPTTPEQTPAAALPPDAHEAALLDHFAGLAMQAHLQAGWTNPGPSSRAYQEWKEDQPAGCEPVNYSDWIANRSFADALSMMRAREAVQLKSRVGWTGRPATLADPEFAEALEDFRRRVTSSPEAARAFLREVGIIDSHGRLTKTYGG